MSQSGSSTSTFVNYLRLTREARLSGPDDIINDVVRRTHLIGQMIGRRDNSEVVRGGRYISERVKLLRGGNFGAFTPGGIRTPTRSETIQEINYPWAYVENNVPFTEFETEDNDGDEFAKFKSFEKSIDMDLATDHLEGMEEEIWRIPNADLMEGAGPATGGHKRMFSIPAWVPEAASGLPGTASGFTAWSTIGGINPATYSNWIPQRATYDSANPDSVDAGLFAAFDQITRKCSFVQPAGFAAYSESDDLSKLCFCTNGNGSDMFAQQLRAGNDHTRAGPQDPSYGMPVFRGIPIKYIAYLDEALLDATGASTPYDRVWPTGKPRFFALNFKYLFMVFHPKHFMRVTDPIHGGVAQRDTYAIFQESKCNLVARSRRRQGIIVPA